MGPNEKINADWTHSSMFWRQFKILLQIALTPLEVQNGSHKKSQQAQRIAEFEILITITNMTSDDVRVFEG